MGFGTPAGEVIELEEIVDKEALKKICKKCGRSGYAKRLCWSCYEKQPRRRKQKNEFKKEYLQRPGVKARVSAWTKAYYQKNRKRILAVQHKYQASNRALINARQCARWKNNPEECRKKMREYMRAYNKDPVHRTKYLAGQKRYRETHAEQIVARTRRWRERNRARYNLWCVEYRKKRKLAGKL